MNLARLIVRLIGRPLARERLRTVLTTLAVALGVAVVVAIDLAGEASTGSFQSSLETLSGPAVYEISAIGGVDEELIGELVRLPYPIRFAARMEDFAVVEASGERVPLFGVDFIGDPVTEGSARMLRDDSPEYFSENAALVGGALGYVRGDTMRLAINDRAHQLKVAGVLDEGGSKERAQGRLVVIDIAAAQRLLNRLGKIDRIYVYGDLERGDWQQALRAAIPAGVALDLSGARTDQNRRMLGAFRSNLRVLSYIAMIVGAFLIYNTIAVSVVRRRTEIGILRALGASRSMVRRAFLIEGAMFGVVGSAIGLPLGRFLATGAVQSMGATVSSLYVTSTPGEIEFSVWTVAAALLSGVGVAILSAWLPATEASGVTPVEAMGQERIEYHSRNKSGRNSLHAAICVVGAAGLSFVPAWNRIPVAGYLAALLLIAAAAFLVPAATDRAMRRTAAWLLRPFGIESFLAARGLAASLARTSVLVAALSTAVAMMVSVGIMVGSFRDTVIVWMDNQLGADLYVRPAGRGGGDRSQTMDSRVAESINATHEVFAVDRFRTYRITYNSLPTTLAFGEVDVHGRRTATRFLEGPSEVEIWDALTSGDSVIVSEPFSQKHDVHAGGQITLPLSGREVEFDVAGVYYDYSGEQGFIIGDRAVLLKHLPDPRLSSLAVYLSEGVDLERGREAVVEATGDFNVFVATNRMLREQGIAVFDRTFAITYALEAVAVVVAILGMAVALLALVIDRRREIGVLRFVGASTAQIRKMVLVQAGLLGILSNVIGLVLGFGLSLILIYVINKQSFGWTIQFHWPVGLLLAGLTGIYVASLLAGLYLATLAARVIPADVVHEE